MSTNVIYLNKEINEAVSLSRFLETRNGSAHFSSTIHVNPLCTVNKILVNKEKLNKGFRAKETLPVAVSERIYYNPKFLSNHVQNASDIYFKSCNQNHSSQNGCATTYDSNIHINRNYLVTSNDARTVKSFNYLTDETCKNTNMPNRGGIHINPKFIRKQKLIENIKVDDVSDGISSSSQPAKTSFKSSSPIKKKSCLKNALINSLNRNTIKLGLQTKSRYKFIKNVNSPQKIQIPQKNQNSPKSLCFKTKYSLKRVERGCTKMNYKVCEMQKLKTQINSKIKIVKPLSEFKKLSRTKLVRKSVLQSMILARRSSRTNLFKNLTNRAGFKRISPKKKTTNLTYFPKRNEPTNKNKCGNVGINSFKRLSKTKIVRKSLLKAQIEARNQVRKQHLRNRKILKLHNKSYISKFKVRNDILRRKYVTKQRALLKWRKKKQGSDNLRIKCKKNNSNVPNCKNLRKNNQPCPFYNRFGRCKGKERGTCPKLHDAKYISICRKLLQGECNAKDCLLSHDIRPGKMPTCHHYLAGLCTRPNCPFLHIKVNTKAPICTAFLQGFCPDVFNCLKRHEFICPIFAEKGACPRGKSCTYPHRSPVVHSKLLRDDQKPLLIHRTDSLMNSNFELNSKKEVSNSSDTTLDCCDNREKRKRNLENIKKKQKTFVKEPFTRYFAINNIDESCDTDETSLKKENIVVDININEFR